MLRSPYVCVSIVAILGAVAIIGSAGVVACAMLGKESPPALVAIVSTTLGSLASFLVHIPTRRDELPVLSFTGRRLEDQ